MKVKSDESLAETPRSSEDDFDSAFIENGENGEPVVSQPDTFQSIPKHICYSLQKYSHSVKSLTCKKTREAEVPLVLSSESLPNPICVRFMCSNRFDDSRCFEILFLTDFPPPAGLSSLTAMLDNKLRSLRNSSVDSSDKEDKPQSTSNQSQPRLSVTSKISHIHNPLSRPLTLGENIPFADESPERPLIQARVKPIRHSTLNTSMDKAKNDTIMEQKNDSSSDETDSSTTSNHRERNRSVIRLEDSVLRKVNR